MYDNSIGEELTLKALLIIYTRLNIYALSLILRTVYLYRKLVCIYLICDPGFHALCIHHRYCSLPVAFTAGQLKTL